MIKSIVTGLFSFLIVLSVNSQEIIKLNNPSFEDTAKVSTIPFGWTNCGSDRESPPDLLPSGDYGVTQTARHGKTFMGMVTRDNGTWESIGSSLNQPLKAEAKYQFIVFLAKSDAYVSLKKYKETKVDYNKAIVLRIWGGNAACEKTELLGESEKIAHSDWKEYVFNLTPSEEYSYLTLEAFYKTPVMFEYNGNILLDNCSPLYEVVVNANGEEVIRYEEKYSDSISLEEIKEAINLCALENYNAEGSEGALVNTTILKNIASFEKTTKNMGLRQYLLATPKSKLFVIIKNLEVVLWRKTAEILKETALIYYKNNSDKEITPEELAIFENSDAAFIKALENDNALERIDEFILRNKRAIIRELNICN